MSPIAGRGEPILYLDFDGVLHAPNVAGLSGIAFGPDIIVSDGQLFEHVGLLERALYPHPRVRLVLATSWVPVLGLEFAVSKLSVALQTRVVGATFDPAIHRAGFHSVARGYQILDDVERRRPSSWMALDDDDRDWPEEHRARLVHVNSRLALAEPAALKALEIGLKTLD